MKKFLSLLRCDTRIVVDNELFASHFHISSRSACGVSVDRRFYHEPVQSL